MPVSGTPKEIIGEEMGRYKRGELHSGPDKYGRFAKNRAQAVAIAMSVARKNGRATGGASPPWFVKNEARGMLHTGPIKSPVAGRTDHIPLNVPNGSYVVPSDVVSHIGQGNTSAGHARLTQMFHGGHLPAASGVRGGRPASSMGMSKSPAGGLPPVFKAGGVTDGDDEGVPIMAAGGEHVLSPEEVAHVGGGDIDHGHRILDAWMKKVRQDNIKTLRNLPGPARD
jgi:hypothetical protein